MMHVKAPFKFNWKWSNPTFWPIGSKSKTTVTSKQRQLVPSLKSVNTFRVTASAKNLIKPAHTCSLQLPRDTTNILRCPSHLTSHNDILRITAFDGVLLTACPQSAQLCVWLLASARSAAPANSVILRLCVCRHASARPWQLPLADLTAQWKVITRQPVPRPYPKAPPHKFLPPAVCPPRRRPGSVTVPLAHLLGMGRRSVPVEGENTSDYASENH